MRAMARAGSGRATAEMKSKVSPGPKAARHRSASAATSGLSIATDRGVNARLESLRRRV
jgi:hypothetical protein